ncbi:MAG: hypothetical protein NT145_01100 [Elusimicrobia bacterium]|nr:hypothetical protein [Elusimicrobiota bacterium]
MQVVDDLRIPNGKWGTADHLEPLVKDMTNWGGKGEGTQAVTNQRIVIDEIKNINKNEVLYEKSK